MNNFSFQNATKLLFGQGMEQKVGEETAKYSKKILLHYGGGSIKKSGLYDLVCASLKASGVSFVELGGVQPNPRLSLVREGIEICRKENVGFILAVGGGSVIDSAKAIAAGVPYDQDVWDFFMDRAIIHQALPVGTVLTIPAAGSETSHSAVVTNDEGQLKRDIGAQCLRPVFSIMNPEMTFTLPAYQTACGVTDMIAHILERYFTNVKDVDLTDRLCEATLKTVINYAPVAIANPTDYAARAELMWAGTIAHNGLLDTGRTGDWASHMIEHELSGIYDVAHGAGLAVIFPAWMKYVMAHDVQRFVQFAVRVFDVDLAFESPENIAREGIARFERFLSSIGMPVRLSGLQIDRSRLAEMAGKAVRDWGSVGSFVQLMAEDVLKIYELAL